MFTNEIFPVSSKKCAKIKIALSVQIEKCAKYLQCQYIPIYNNLSLLVNFGEFKTGDEVFQLWHFT